MASEIDIFCSLIFNFHLLQFLTTLPYKSKNSTESNFLRQIISPFFALWSDLFWFWNWSKPEIEGNRTFKNQNKQKESERKLEEKKQILFENSTWKFVFSEAIPKRFSSIKVGLFMFFNLNCFKTGINCLKNILYGLMTILWAQILVEII